MKDSIKAGEIRKGNYLRHIVHGIIKIQGAWAEPVKDGDFERVRHNGEWHLLGHCEPIPLSNEALEKCGFKKVNHIDGYSFYSMDKLYIYDNYTEYRGVRIAHCMYVHQLQNAAPVIFGKELEITM